ncbi:DUF1440 domain-containing protein [Phenylobacterium deserti]|uniref:DUF1440 domain-containing protein n=1 Tax=Phenylobacterium deserti TaxID=1914756 RepID=A0A328ATY9_9CAUL|nr:DUF1440 domain-containing protein [Phenylobacterium deserti]RAK58077.1 DUF1440 domain-containing protein [Phenylobacterium deserti]
MSHEASNVWRGVLLGAAAGLAASWAMEQYQAAASKAAEAAGQDLGGGDGDPATVQAADRAVRRVTGEGLADAQKSSAGEAVHYAFGAFLGAVYGALAEVAPAVRSGFGSIYGLVVALVADEGAVPRLRLGPGPSETPAKLQAYALSSHVAFGVSLEAARRVLSLVFGPGR